MDKSLLPAPEFIKIFPGPYYFISNLDLSLGLKINNFINFPELEIGDLIFRNNIINFSINNFSPFIYNIGIPDNCLVYCLSESEFKSDKIILLEKYNYLDHPLWDNHKLLAGYIQKIPEIIRFVKNLTPDLELLAVKQNGKLIKYIKNPSREICQISLSQNPHNLALILDQSENIILFALNRDILAHKYILNNTILNKLKPFLDNPSLESYQKLEYKFDSIYIGKDFNKKFYGPFMCYSGDNKPPGLVYSRNIFYYDDYICEAKYYRYLIHCGYYFYEINIPVDALLFISQKKIYSTKLIYSKSYNYSDFPVFNNLDQYTKILTFRNLAANPRLSLDITKKLVKTDGLFLEYIKIQTFELCLLAIQNNPLAIKFVKKINKTDQVCEKAIKTDGKLLAYLEPDIQTEELALLALESSLLNINHVQIITKKLINISDFINNFLYNPTLELYSELKKITGLEILKF